MGFTVSGRLRLEQASLKSQKSKIFCDYLNSLDYIASPCVVNPTYLVHPADLNKHLIRVVQILPDPGLSQIMYPLLRHEFVPRTGDKKNGNASGSFCFGTAWTTCQQQAVNHEAVPACVHVCGREKRTEYACMHCAHACMCV